MVRKEHCVDNMNANNMDVSKSVIAPYDENLFLGNEEETLIKNLMPSKVKRDHWYNL